MPLLIPYRCTHAVPVIRVISEKANAKEISLVLQEILERLSHRGEQDDEEEQEEKSENLSSTLQLERIVFSYAYGAVALYFVATETSPRGVISSATSATQGKNYGGASSRSASRPRKRYSNPGPMLPTARGSGGSPLSNCAYQQPLGLLCGSSFRYHTTDTMHCECDLRRQSPILTAKQDALFSLLDTTLAASVNCLHTCLAQRTFEALYPTLVVNSAIYPEWNAGEKLVLGALVLSLALTLSSAPIDPHFRLPQPGWVMTPLRFRVILHSEVLYSWHTWTYRMPITLHCSRPICLSF